MIYTSVNIGCENSVFKEPRWITTSETTSSLWATFLPLTVHRTCLKNCAKLFFPELCQISTNCEIFWHKDGKENKRMLGVLSFHLTQFTPTHYRFKRRCTKLLHKAAVNCLTHTINRNMVYLTEYGIWRVLWEKVYCSKLGDVNELQTRLVDEWEQFDCWCRYQAAASSSQGAFDRVRGAHLLAILPLW